MFVIHERKNDTYVDFRRKSDWSSGVHVYSNLSWIPDNASIILHKDYELIDAYCDDMKVGEYNKKSFVKDEKVGYVLVQS